MNRICLLVSGSRDWTNFTVVQERILAHYSGPAYPRVGHVLLAGDARGLDRIAQGIGSDRGWIVEPTPYFSEFEKEGGWRRNALLVDKLLCYGRHGYSMRFEAFPLPNSKGTIDCINQVKRANQFGEIMVNVWGKR